MNSGIKCHLDLLGCLDLCKHGNKTGNLVLFLYNTKNTLLPAEYSCYDLLGSVTILMFYI